MRRSPHIRGPVVLASTLSMTAALALVAPQVGAAQAVVTDLTPPISPVVLSRLQSDDVTLTFKVTSEDGQSRAPRVVDRTDAGGFAPVAATLSSGDLTDGIWEAEVTLGSFMDGSHDPRVLVCEPGESCVAYDLSTTIVVNGSDWPVLASVKQRPERLGAGRTTGADAAGRVVYSSTRDPVEGLSVRLVRERGGAGQVVDHTDADGRFTSPWPWTQPGMDAARIVVTSSAFSGAQVDGEVLGNPRTRFLVSRPKAPDVAVRRVVVRGTVRPGFPASRLGQVQLQHLTDSGWVTRDRSHVRPVKTSAGPQNRARYRLSVSFGQMGKHALRVVKPAAMCGGPGSCRVASGRSEPFSVLVGNRAFFVERHLSALGVPVGEVDGDVDARSQQAFCAWRDMVGMKPTRQGLSPRLVRSVMRAKSLPDPGRSDGLYVNKTCQILFQVKSDKYRRVVWVSSGGPGYDTPNGTGAIFRKIEGWVESTLYPEAYMLDPMFFFPDRPAIALHGSASNSLVLPYPASHGCVRTWRPQISRIFDESPIGTKVQIYGHY